MEKIYDHQKAEAKAQEFWQENNVYSQENNSGPIYSIDTPPPTVSGSLHIGHIFSYTQTDIIARYKRMSGFSVFYPFGFDDNGLPTEKFVEKKLDIQAFSMPRSEFIKLCLNETIKVEAKFKKLWQNIGLSVDWSLCYSTIDNDCRKISQLSFIELYKKGFIYRKDEPALYCTTCRTTVAQAELDDIEKPATFCDIIFKCENENLIIATTRPELLPAVVAVFYHPEDTRYAHLEGKKAKVAFFGQEVPILKDEDVDPKKGTGLVMCATFGDKTDINWFKKHKLNYVQAIGLDGKWTESTGPLAGLRVASAREKIITLLKEAGLILNQKNITHSVNVHERCKKEIEYLVLPQWFLNILPYKQNFIELGDKINWYPGFMKSRYKNWVENVSWDWCLSRQRFYGIPFPVWHCLDCKEIILAQPKDLPIDPQENNLVKTCPKCNSGNIKADTDVMDTWNTSSLTPYFLANLSNKNKTGIFDFDKVTFLPLNMRPQAHDIIRTWAFYTIIKAWMHNNSIPWENIVISGHVLSTEKEKISKSQGNAPLAPENLLNTYPADAIRYWTASGTLGYDIAFSSSQIAIGQKLLVKLFNAFKFSTQYIQDFKDIGEPKDLGLVNEWILDSLSSCFENYKKYFDNNEFGLALDTIEKFFWADYCDYYLELIKDQLSNQANQDKYTQDQVYATSWTLYNVGLKIIQLYAPFIPHITENIYQEIYKKNINTLSIHQLQFNNTIKDYKFEQSKIQMGYILNLIAQIRKLKSEHKLSLKTEIAELVIYLDKSLEKIFKDQENLIKGITKSLNIIYIFEDGKTSLTCQNEIYKAYINLNHDKN